MKKFITLLILLCTVIGAKAALTVTTQPNGTVVITTDGYGQITSEALSHLSNDVQNSLRNATTIKLVGYFNSDPDFLQLKGYNQKVEILDLKEAHIAQGTPSYTYYYLIDNEDKNNKRKVLSQDGNRWYYTENNQRVYVAEEDVRIYTASITGGQNLPGEWKNTLKELYLPEFSDYNVLGADFANGFTKLTKVNIPQNITVLGDKAFYECKSLKDVKLPDNLKVIGKWALYKTALEELTIPGSVEIIEYLALSECETITKLIFAESDDSPNHQMIMKYYSVFNLANLSDIYIETTSAVDCENEAFDYRITWGQANVNAPFCTLHFSSSVAEHYANLSHPLTQQIAQDPVRFHQWLHAHYSAASSSKGGNGWWEFINNGTTDEEDKIEGTKFLRTYSDYNYDRIVPEGVKAYAVTNITSNDDNTFSVDLLQLLVIPKRTGVILYGVSNSKDKSGNPVLSMSLCEIANGLPLRRDYWYALEDNDDNHLKNYLWPTCVSLDETKYEDEGYWYYYLNNDGTVMQDESGDYKMEMRTRSVLANNTGKFSVAPWDDVKDGTFDNMLLPTPPSTIVDSQGHVVEDGDDNIRYDASKLNGFYRNFYLNYYSTTDPGTGKTPADKDFMGFFRAKKNSSMDTNHAFLRVRSDEYTDGNGVEVIVNPDTENYPGKTFASYQVEFKKGEGTPLSPDESGYWKVPGGNPDMQWDKPDNWGKRPENFEILTKYIGEPIIEGEDGHATMIIGPVQDNNAKDPYFYTIQGVRIAKPTAPGIYIHNGKKVVIK